jgi:hypothetical protein
VKSSEDEFLVSPIQVEGGDAKDSEHVEECPDCPEGELHHSVLFLVQRLISNSAIK